MNENVWTPQLVVCSIVEAQDVALRTPAADILCITHTKALLEDQTREDINCTHTLHSKFIWIYSLVFHETKDIVPKALIV